MTPIGSFRPRQRPVAVLVAVVVLATSLAAVTEAPPAGAVAPPGFNAELVGMAATPSGAGYWLLGDDGGIFSYGDARFHGSTGDRRLNRPIVGMAATPSGRGYWLVASDGGIFSFGDARFFGSTGAIPLRSPIVAILGATGGPGYMLVAADGGTFAFGAARFAGSAAGRYAWPFVGAATAPTGAWLLTAQGNVVPVGGAPDLGGPGYEATIDRIDAATRGRMTRSWRPGCPVGLGDLRLLRLEHRDFSGAVRTGELVVHADAARPVVEVFRLLFVVRYPVARMRLVDEYGADDGASMAANNTSAFNCRFVGGRPGVWSQHAYGRAVDLNPVQNPYVVSGRVTPAAGAEYLDRTRPRPGVIRAGDAVVRAFASVGWGWGGHFTSAKDYHHFSATGG